MPRKGARDVGLEQRARAVERLWREAGDTSRVACRQAPYRARDAALQVQCEGANAVRDVVGKLRNELVGIGSASKSRRLRSGNGR